MRFFQPALLGAALIALAPLPALAGTTIGGSLGSARVNDGDFEGSDTGWKVFVGSYGQLFGGEIAYIDFGEQGDDLVSAEAKAWAPALMVGIPMGMAQIHGKLGIAFPEVEGQDVADEYEDNEVFYGLGARFGHQKGPGLGFRLEYERFQFGPDDLDLASAGLEFRF